MYKTFTCDKCICYIGVEVKDSTVMFSLLVKALLFAWMLQKVRKPWEAMQDFCMYDFSCDLDKKESNFNKKKVSNLWN